jgi:ferredoxin-NADP reductase
MTITTEPSDPLIGITTRFSDLPRSSYKQALLTLEPNAAVGLSDAMGDLVLPLDSTMPLVFVAGGVGIASYVSMVRFLLHRRDARSVTLLYSVRGVKDIVFQDLFDKYAPIGTLEKTLFTTDNKVDGLGWNGTISKSRLTAADIANAAGADAQIYISGSQTMVEHLRSELEGKYGIPQYRIAFDYFDGYVET